MLVFEWNFLGLSSETKPLNNEKVINGSTFYECDTSNFFIYYNGEWYKQIFVTDDGINVYLYKFLMHKMFKNAFDTNISKLHVYKPEISSNISFTSVLPSNITEMEIYGNTEQQTYSGKNLMPMALSDNTTSRSNNFKISLPAGTYTVSFDLSDISLGSNQDFNIAMTIAGAASGGGNYDTVISGTISSTEATHKSFTFTTTADSNVSLNSNIRIGQTYWDNGARAKLSNIQIEAGSITTSYEPYTGGIPSPNPDYPQEIHSVTGEQTVTINGEQIYTIDLGSTELCKLGDYQDYIYKSGDDWYLHKDIKKDTYNGSEAWTLNVNSAYAFRHIISDAIDPLAVDQNAAPSILTNAYAPIAWNSGISDRPDYCVSNNASNNTLAVKNADYTDLTSFKTFLSTNNLIIYYPLATPTDTQITDNTLISSLNSIMSYTFPAGINSITVSASNLPALLKLTIIEKE